MVEGFAIALKKHEAVAAIAALNVAAINVLLIKFAVINIAFSLKITNPSHPCSLLFYREFKGKNARLQRKDRLYTVKIQTASTER